MGDALDDDFDQDEINNYENIDSDSEIEIEQQIEQEKEEIEQEQEEEIEENNELNNKKKKRKQKFDELKLKKKLKNENNNDNNNNNNNNNQSLNSLNQLNLLSKHNLLLNESNFLDIGLIKGKKNHFVHAMEIGISSFKELIHNNNNSIQPGSPYVVIVCSGAKRAASVINTISKQVKCKIGKLFAKHFKVQDQVEALRQSFPIVVGTPNRLSKLIELGALSLSETKLVLIDLQLDSKSYSILDLPEVSDDFYNFLSNFVQNELNHLQLSLIQEPNIPVSNTNSNSSNNSNNSTSKFKSNKNGSKKFKSFKKIKK